MRGSAKRRLAEQFQPPVTCVFSHSMSGGSVEGVVPLFQTEDVFFR